MNLDLKLACVSSQNNFTFGFHTKQTREQLGETRHQYCTAEEFEFVGYQLLFPSLQLMGELTFSAQLYLVYYAIVKN
jgi:hypothetical protein